MKHLHNTEIFRILEKREYRTFWVIFDGSRTRRRESNPHSTPCIPAQGFTRLSRKRHKRRTLVLRLPHGPSANHLLLNFSLDKEIAYVVLYSQVKKRPAAFLYHLDHNINDKKRWPEPL